MLKVISKNNINFPSTTKSSFTSNINTDYLQTTELTDLLLTDRNRNQLYASVIDKLKSQYSGGESIDPVFVAGVINTMITRVINDYGIETCSPAFASVMTLHTAVNMMNEQIVKRSMSKIVSNITMNSIVNKDIDINLISANKSTRGIYAPPPLFPRNTPYGLPSNKKVNQPEYWHGSASRQFSISIS